MVAALTSLQNCLTEMLKYLDKNYPNTGQSGGSSLGGDVKGKIEKDSDSRKW